MPGYEPAVEPPRPGDPRHVGPYQVEGRLGAGGMGVVFLARSPGGRRVAVKQIHGHLLDGDPGFRARFRQEMDAARRVGGFYTAAVVDGDADAPSPWYASAYLPAPSLQDRLDGGRLDEPAARELCSALAEALSAVHREGLVHRDLKPSNVLMADDGPRLIDFGIVRAVERRPGETLTGTGGVIGSVGYLSPEQLEGSTITGASDVFALGVLLVMALTGHLPFRGGTGTAVALATLRDEPDLAGVPPRLLPVLRRCLDRDPQRRPELGELMRLRSPSPAPPPSRSGAPSPPVPPPSPWIPARASQQAPPRPDATPPRPDATPPGPVARLRPGRDDTRQWPADDTADRAADDLVRVAPGIGRCAAVVLAVGGVLAAAGALAGFGPGGIAVLAGAASLLAVPLVRPVRRTVQDSESGRGCALVLVNLTPAAVVVATLALRADMVWWARVLVGLGVVALSLVALLAIAVAAGVESAVVLPSQALAVLAGVAVPAVIGIGRGYSLWLLVVLGVVVGLTVGIWSGAVLRGAYHRVPRERA